MGAILEDVDTPGDPILPDLGPPPVPEPAPTKDWLPHQWRMMDKAIEKMRYSSVGVAENLERIASDTKDGFEVEHYTRESLEAALMIRHWAKKIGNSAEGLINTLSQRAMKL